MYQCQVDVDMLNAVRQPTNSLWRSTYPHQPYVDTFFFVLKCLPFITIIFQLYNVNSGGEPELVEEPISGMLFEKFPTSPKSDRRYFVMVSTIRQDNGTIKEVKESNVKPSGDQKQASPQQVTVSDRYHYGQ